MKRNKLDGTLRLVAIKTKSKVFISDNYKGESYFYTKLDRYIIDGEKPKGTYNENWFEVKQLPQRIEQQLPAEKVNKRYELREGFQVTDLTPKVINESYIDEDSEYYEVKGLYEFKYDELEPRLEELEFEINVVEELDTEFEITKQEYELKYNLIDRIQTHPVLLPTKPCSLSREDTYKIIRNHVKTNIDPRYATITSDYDFCLTVKKKIELYEPNQYQVNVNQGTRRRPKYETRFNRTREITVYEAAPKSYQSYTIVEPFTGYNAEDLNNNIKLFLDELMDKINEPFIECECCKGTGVILDGTN